MTAKLLNRLPEAVDQLRETLIWIVPLAGAVAGATAAGVYHLLRRGQ